MKINFSTLDGLRGIAATYVVINHCRGNLLSGGAEYAKTVPVDQWSLTTKSYFGALQLTTLGWEFVVFFFVLSGFSIAHSLRKNTSKIAFLKKRAIRLYLPYAIALAWAAFVFEILAIENIPFIGLGKGSTFDLTNYNLLKNIFYIPSGSLIPQFWSLPHEVIFYLIAPFLIFNSKSRIIYYVLSAAFYIYGWKYGLVGTPYEGILNRFLYESNIFFAVGIYLYHNYDLIEKITKTNKLGLLIIFVGSICLMILIRLYFNSMNNKFSALVSGILTIFMITNFLRYNINNVILEFLGKMSYTLYITHFASIYFFIFILYKIDILKETQLSNIWYLWILAVLFSIIISQIIYVIGERQTKVLLLKIRGKESKT